MFPSNKNQKRKQEKPKESQRIRKMKKVLEFNPLQQIIVCHKGKGLSQQSESLKKLVLSTKVWLFLNCWQKISLDPMKSLNPSLEECQLLEGTAS